MEWVYNLKGKQKCTQNLYGKMRSKWGGNIKL